MQRNSLRFALFRAVLVVVGSSLVARYLGPLPAMALLTAMGSLMVLYQRKVLHQSWQVILMGKSSQDHAPQLRSQAPPP